MTARPRLHLALERERDGLCPACRSVAGKLVRWLVPGDVTGGYELVDCPCRAGANRGDLIARARSAANLDALMAGQTFATFSADRQPKAMELARSFAASPTGMAIFCGLPGTGKTHLLAAIANDLIGRAEGVRYVVMGRLVNIQRMAMGDTERQREARAEWDAALDAPVLLLDDLGTEASTPFAQEQVFNLLDYRYANGRPTAIATNMAPKDLPVRVASRLRDVTRCRWAVLTGDDVRRARSA